MLLKGKEPMNENQILRGISSLALQRRESTPIVRAKNAMPCRRNNRIGNIMERISRWKSAIVSDEAVERPKIHAEEIGK